MYNRIGFQQHREPNRKCYNYLLLRSTSINTIFRCPLGARSFQFLIFFWYSGNPAVIFLSKFPDLFLWYLTSCWGSVHFLSIIPRYITFQPEAWNSWFLYFCLFQFSIKRECQPSESIHRDNEKDRTFKLKKNVCFMRQSNLWVYKTFTIYSFYRLQWKITRSVAVININV